MPIRICRRPKRPRLRARRVCSHAPIRCCRYPCCSAWLLLRTWHRCVPGGSTGPLVWAALFFSSVVVSKFATFRYRSPSELRNRDTGGSSVSQNFESCEDIIRKSDYDRYAAAVFAPKRVRGHLCALYAFNYEIAKTGETVSEVLAGQIRLQWWRDAIAELREGKRREHPVVLALAEVLRAHDLPQNLFDQMIDARECDLDEMPFQDMTGLETYADAT